MINWFIELNPIFQATLAGVFTWACTAIGSAVVYLFRDVNRKLLDIMNGFAAGIMIAASFWSLLAPSIEYSQAGGYGKFSFVPPVIGFLLGGVFLRLIDAVVPNMDFASKTGVEGPRTSLSPTTLLFLAITIHNFPEGLSVGVAYGAGEMGLSSASIKSALILTIGIGLQNLPEGSALSMPIRSGGAPKNHAFNLGQASALVEIIGAALGAWLVTQVTIILPYALSFAAGAMIFVCVEELIPESQTNGNNDVATIALLCGFALMMSLDVGLG